MMQVISKEILEIMRSRGGDWYAYQNQDLGHKELGHLKFLKCGEDCTFFLPPKILPDTPLEINWRYVFAGKLDIKTGELEKPTTIKEIDNETARIFQDC